MVGQLTSGGGLKVAEGAGVGEGLAKVGGLDVVGHAVALGGLIGAEGALDLLLQVDDLDVAVEAALENSYLRNLD